MCPEFVLLDLNGRFALLAPDNPSRATSFNGTVAISWAGQLMATSTRRPGTRNLSVVKSTPLLLVLNARRPMARARAHLECIGTLSHGRAAEELLPKALADDPDDVNSRHNSALLLAKHGEFAEADRLWRSNPDFLASRVALADSLSQRGQLAQAVQEYLAVVSLEARLRGSPRSSREIVLTPKGTSRSHGADRGGLSAVVRERTPARNPCGRSSPSRSNGCRASRLD